MDYKGVVGTAADKVLVPQNVGSEEVNSSEFKMVSKVYRQQECEDEEFELNGGRADRTLYIGFQSVQTFQENRGSNLATKVIRPGILD